MLLYKLDTGIAVHNEHGHFVLEQTDWDAFVNDDRLTDKMEDITGGRAAAKVAYDDYQHRIAAPVGKQEIWASGVTYLRSKVGREEEAKDAGGGRFYDMVYYAERPELFFKGTADRAVGHRGTVRLRADSDWNVPEPEMTLCITSGACIVGYTIGNDMSSRSIEGANPLYLPQAKVYDGSAALGPAIYVPGTPLKPDTEIGMVVIRGGTAVFTDTIAINRMKRRPYELVDYLFRECTFPHGCLLMTGTGIVPPADFTLHSGDEIHITMEPVGTLINVVE